MAARERVHVRERHAAPGIGSRPREDGLRAVRRGLGDKRRCDQDQRIAPAAGPQQRDRGDRDDDRDPNETANPAKRSRRPFRGGRHVRAVPFGDPDVEAADRAACLLIGGERGEENKAYGGNDDVLQRRS
jgi:hypothetical protein